MKIYRENPYFFTIIQKYRAFYMKKKGLCLNETASGFWSG